MLTFLIAHTNSAGSGVAQAKVKAVTEAQAVAKFAVRYPGRVLTVVEVERAPR
jgi:hypothetical protein